MTKVKSKTEDATAQPHPQPVLLAGTTDIINPQVLDWCNSVATHIANNYSTLFQNANSEKTGWRTTRGFKIPGAVRARLDQDQHGRLEDLEITLDLEQSRMFFTLQNPHAVYPISSGTDFPCGSLAEFKDWLDEQGGTEMITLMLVWLVFKASLQFCVSEVVF